MPNTNPNEISQEITPENLGDLTLFNNNPEITDSQSAETINTNDPNADETINVTDPNADKRRSIFRDISQKLGLEESRIENEKFKRRRSLFLKFVACPIILFIPTIYYFANNKKFSPDVSEPNITSYRDKNAYLNDMVRYNKTAENDSSSYYALQGLLPLLSFFLCFCYHHNKTCLKIIRGSRIKIDGQVGTIDQENIPQELSIANDSQPQRNADSQNLIPQTPELSIANDSRPERNDDSQNPSDSGRRPSSNVAIISSSPKTIRFV